MTNLSQTAMEVLNNFSRIEEGTEENIINNDNVGMVLEETEIIDGEENVETVSEEDNVQYQLCEINRNDNAVAYRVVQVNETHADGGEVSIATPVNNTVQVLTSPINGQLYLLSNGNEVLTSESGRSTMPRVTKLQIDTSENIITGIKKRDERRRVTHNEVERRRRDKINNWISKLGKLLPDNEQSINGNGDIKSNSELQSKGGILARACEYITELREMQENFTRNLEENTQLLEEAKNLRQIVNQLRKENSQLKAQLSDNTNYILGT